MQFQYFKGGGIACTRDYPKSNAPHTQCWPTNKISARPDRGEAKIKTGDGGGVVLHAIWVLHVHQMPHSRPPGEVVSRGGQPQKCLVNVVSKWSGNVDDDMTITASRRCTRDSRPYRQSDWAKRWLPWHSARRRLMRHTEGRSSRDLVSQAVTDHGKGESPA